MIEPRLIKDSDDRAIRFRIAGEDVLVLDEQGITYKGQRIEDAGAAHAAFMEVMLKLMYPLVKVEEIKES